MAEKTPLQRMQDLVDKASEKINALNQKIKDVSPWKGLSRTTGNSLSLDEEAKLFFKERTPAQIKQALFSLSNTNNFSDADKETIQSFSQALQSIGIRIEKVETVPEVGNSNALYLENSTGFIKTWNGVDYDTHGGDQLTYDKLITALGFTPLNANQKGSPNGVAETDQNNIILPQHLPSYVDDVLEGTYINSTTFNNGSGSLYTPESGKIYIDTNSGKQYRWTGSIYSQLNGGLVLGETSQTAYRGDRGKQAYDHISKTNNPHNVTAEQVGAETPSGAQSKANQAEQNANDYTDQKFTGINSSREVKIVPNTSQYTFATEDFISKFLVFTGGTSINAFVPSTRTDTSGEVQGITLGNTILNFKPFGDATVTPTIGALPKTVGNGSVFGIKMPIEDDYRVFGTLELENPVSSDIDASNIVSGRISYDRLPGGISSAKINQWDAADNYGHFRVGINGSELSNVNSDDALNFVAGSNITLSKNGNSITIAGLAGGGSYSLMSLSEHNTGASTTAKLVNAKNLNDWLVAKGYDKYSHWRLGVNGAGYTNISTDNAVNFAAGTNVTISRTGNTITINASGGSGSVTWSSITGKPTTFPPSTHSHSLSQIPKVVTDVGINQSNGNLVVYYSDGTSSEKTFGTITANDFKEK